MKHFWNRFWIVLLASALLEPSISKASPPPIIPYQGRVTVSGRPFNGNGHFKFALVNGTASKTWWSNDGTSNAGSEPAAAVSLNVTNGLYSVFLGDTSVSGMSQALQTAFFSDSSDVWLRVWFDDGRHGSQWLAPDQRFGSVGYALAAQWVTGPIPGANISPGSITSASLANGAVNNQILADAAVTNSKLAPSAVKTSNLVDGSVTSSKLAPDAVTTPALADGAVTTTKLAPGTVTTPVLADGSITTAKVSLGAVTTPILADGSVTGAKLALGAVGAANLAPGLTLWNPANGGITYSGGNVGIGTSVPQTQLHILPPSTFNSGDLMTVGGDQDPNIIGYNSALRFGLNGTVGGSAYINFFAGGFYPHSGSLLLNPDGGRVGVATHNALAPLHVTGRNSVGIICLLGGDVNPANPSPSSLSLGLTQDTGGSGFIQVVSREGISFGTLQLNPNAGIVSVGTPAYSDATFQVRRRPEHSYGTDFLTSDGTVSVSVDTPSYALRVYGEAYKDNGNPFWNTTSDSRLKSDIHSLTSSLETLEQVRPVRFRYNEQYRAQSHSVPATEQFGVIAQEYARVFPDFVSTNPDGYLSVNTSPLVFLNTAAIQELNHQARERDLQIEQLNARDSELERLKARNSELEQRVSRLENLRAENEVLGARLEALLSRVERLSPSSVSVAAANP